MALCMLPAAVFSICTPVHSFRAWQGWCCWYCSSKENRPVTIYGNVVKPLLQLETNRVEQLWCKDVSSVETIDMVLCWYPKLRERKVKSILPDTKKACIIQQSIDYPQCDSLRLMASTRVKEVMHLDSALKHHERGQLIYKSCGLRNVIHLVWPKIEILRRSGLKQWTSILRFW